MQSEVNAELSPHQRGYCYRCRRAQNMCLCSLLSACQNRTRIHVLQHRRESKHAFNTVHLLRLGLQNMQVHDLPTDVGRGYAMPSGFPVEAGVLYPADHSSDLAELTQENRPNALVVIDGTWDQAHRIYRDNDWLRRLTPYRLSPSEPSRYRIRKEPRAECLSTLESTLMALALIEPETRGLDDILRAFDAMNDRQLACIAEHRGGPKRQKRVRVRPMRAVPSELWERPEHVVVVYGESALPFLHRHKHDRELAQWCAIRLMESDSIFSALATTEGPPPGGEFLQDLQWTQEQMAQAIPLKELQEQWRCFLRPKDRVMAWNASTLRMARAHGLCEQGVVLKHVYGNTTERCFGTLEDVVAHDVLEPLPLPIIPGRAARRLGNAHAAALALGRWALDRQEHDRAIQG